MGRFLPPVDNSQDWVLISGEEIDGRTILEFSRPFSSCDVANDLDIKVKFCYLSLYSAFSLQYFVYRPIHLVLYGRIIHATPPMRRN